MGVCSCSVSWQWINCVEYHSTKVNISDEPWEGFVGPDKRQYGWGALGFSHGRQNVRQWASMRGRVGKGGGVWGTNNNGVGQGNIPHILWCELLITFCDLKYWSYFLDISLKNEGYPTDCTSISCDEPQIVMRAWLFVYVMGFWNHRHSQWSGFTMGTSLVMLSDNAHILCGKIVCCLWVDIHKGFFWEINVWRAPL